MIERCVTHLQKVDINEKIENKTCDGEYIKYDRVTTIKCSYCQYVYVVKHEIIKYRFVETQEKDGTVCHRLSKTQTETKKFWQ